MDDVAILVVVHVLTEAVDPTIVGLARIVLGDPDELALGTSHAPDQENMSDAVSVPPPDPAYDSEIREG
jgi:hypothetical protein